MLDERNLLYMLSDLVETLTERSPTHLRLLPRYARPWKQQLEQEFLAAQDSPHSVQLLLIYTLLLTVASIGLRSVFVVAHTC